jgi:hypothetical protein
LAAHAGFAGFRVTVIFILSMDPFVYFRALETQEPSNAVDRQTALFDPPIHGIGAHAEVLRNLLHASPAVVHGRLLCLPKAAVKSRE